MSIADDFVDVMALINAIEPNGDDPMRYAIWQCQDNAKSVLSSAIQNARSITSAARMIQRDYADEMKVQAAKLKQEQS